MGAPRPDMVPAINLMVEAWEQELETISSSCARLRSSIATVKNGYVTAENGNGNGKGAFWKPDANFKSAQLKRKQLNSNSGRAQSSRSAEERRTLSSGSSLNRAVQKLRLQGFWEEIHSKAQSIGRHNYLDHSGLDASTSQKSRSRTRYTLVNPEARKEIQNALLLPHSSFNCVWSCCALFAVIADASVLPVRLAWNLDTPLYLLVLSTLFWLVDVSLNFCKGYYDRGTLIVDYSKIARRYLCTWFLPDLGVISVDVCVVVMIVAEGTSPGAGMQLTRGFRVLRLMRFARLLRIVRLPGLSERLDELMTHKFAEITVTVIKTCVILLMCVHLLGCFWFFAGSLGKEMNFENNWVLEYDYEEASIGYQYATCFHWVLGQFTPGPMRIQPTNVIERIYNIFVILFAMLVVGSSISRISQSITQAMQLKAEANMRRRKLVKFLRSNKINHELSSRIMQLVDHKLGNEKEAKLDIDLISVRLLKEVVMDRRGPMLCEHQMFSLLQRAFPEVFVDICSALELELYDPSEDIYTRGTRAKGMVVISPGRYSVESGNGEEVFEAESTEFLAELSLFATWEHTSSLRGKSCMDVLTLRAVHFTEALGDHLTCGVFAYQFASSLLKQVNKGKCRAGDSLPESVIETACQHTDCYQSLHMDDSRFLEKFEVSGCTASGVATLHDLLSRVSDLPDEKILEELEAMFPEIRPEVGTHARFSLPEERYRAIASMLSVIYLFANCRERFVQPQGEGMKLSPETWDKLQAFLDWSGVRSDKHFIHIVLVLLALKGLGKAEPIRLQLPAIFIPESAVLYIVEQHPNLVPSTQAIHPEHQRFLLDMLALHEDFQFGQFLQAENNPGSVAALQDESLDASVVKVSLVAALGAMCGLMGDERGGAWQGSKFMDAKNSPGIVMCLEHLRKLHEHTCQQIFWGYVTERVEPLEMHTTTVSDLCLARLACMCRMHTRKEAQVLKDTWLSLDLPVRHVLIDFFLADGVSEAAIVFSYLPLALTNARRNEAVGLAAMLSQLAELIEMTRSRTDFLLADTAHSVMVVNLSDLSSFIGVVKSSFVFETCLEHVMFQQQGNVLYLHMTSMNWNHVDDMESHDTGLPRVMRQMLRTQRVAQKSIDALRVPHEVESAYCHEVVEQDQHTSQFELTLIDDLTPLIADTL